LDNTNKEQHQAILLTLWRSWHLRNDVYHGKGNASIEYSARFLLAYADTLNSNVLATSEPVVTDLKGKKPLIKMHSHAAASSDGDKKPRRWEPPPSDWLKVNIDGSFTPADGKGATGVVIRNSLGETIAAAGSVLENVTVLKKLKPWPSFMALNSQRNRR
jgi:hypothetical protein